MMRKKHQYLIAATLIAGGSQLFGQDVVEEKVQTNRAAIDAHAAQPGHPELSQEVSGIAATVKANGEKIDRVDAKLDRILERLPAR